MRLETVGSAETVFGWMRLVEPGERITEADIDGAGIFYDGPRCAACGEECREVQVDYGVGLYEYWGAVGWDSRIAHVSNCCEAEVVEW